MIVFVQSGEWDINLKAKVKNSLSIKVFLWIASSLILCSLLIYGSILLFLPKSYTIISSDRLNREVEALTTTLSQTRFEKMENVIEEFCQKNQATVMFQDNNKTYQFGDTTKPVSNETEWLFIAQEVKFSDKLDSYILNIEAPIFSSNELQRSLLKLLPFLLIIIALISFLGALFCSRLLVKPIINMSNVSKKMAQLDMTEEYNITRTDEIGVLANSLNTMSKNLSDTMNELENANLQLKHDMEHIAELNKQQQYFFATASHELKTPITIIKGQVESMIMEIGRYKDTKKILPETLKEIENMEQLVKEILSISKLELNTLDRIECVSITTLINRVCDHLLPLASEKDITIHQKIASNVDIPGNESLLEKALHNIITNAICHSPVGANVSITLSEELMLVENEGVNIPREDVDKLFTPFYRVEKSHNKLTGGSGLGLYLVKNILDQHGLPYGIKNTATGVCFEVVLVPRKLNLN